MAEWLRRETRNLMGLPAQVQILLLSNFLFLIDKLLNFFILIESGYIILEYHFISI